MPIPIRSEYEALIYSLPEQYSEIGASTLHLFSTSAKLAIVQGELQFANSLRLRVTEVVDFHRSRIRAYSYSIFQDAQRIRWYDPQPHPENPALQPTFPHHYPEEPDIKHNRLPAYGLSFDEPNFHHLIEVCIQLSNQQDESKGQDHAS